MTDSTYQVADGPLTPAWFWSIVTTTMLLWIIHAAGSVFDAYNGTGGNSSFWLDFPDSGELVVQEAVPGFESPVQPGDVVLSLDGNTHLPRNPFAWRYEFSTMQGELRVRRDGKVIDLSLPRRDYEYRSVVAAKDVIIGLLALVLVFCAPRTRLVSAVIAMLFLSGSIGQGAPVGWSQDAATLLVVIGVSSQLLLWPITMTAVILALDRNAPAWVLGLCTPCSILGVLLFMIYYGDPLPQSLVRSLYFVGIFAFSAIQFLIALRLYPKTRGLVRLQANWLILAASIGVVPIVLAYLVSVFSADAAMVGYFFAGELFWVLLTLAILGATLFHDLIPVNRAAVASVSYAVIAITFALLFEFVLEPLVAWVSGEMGVDADIGQTLIIVAATLAAPRIKAKFEPLSQRIFVNDHATV